MDIRKIMAAVALVAGIAAGGGVNGLLLVMPKNGGNASIIAEGVRIYWHLWLALVAAGATALTIAGTWLAYVAQGEVRAELAAEIDAADQERRRLEDWAQGLEGAMLELSADRRAGEAAIAKEKAAFKAEHQSMIVELERQRREVEQLRGELVGARNHLKRVKRNSSNSPIEKA